MSPVIKFSAMKKKNHIYTALPALLTLISCAQENPEELLSTETRSQIYFRSYLPSVTETRAGIVSNENLTECNVTALNPDDDRAISANSGNIPQYFSDIRFEKNAGGQFLPSDEQACMWPDAKSTLHFFAYHPSVDHMHATIDTEKFNLVNYSKKTDASFDIDYRLENYRVAPDIEDQVDFIAAYSTGSRKDSGDNGIALHFTHQLARIDISAWGASEKYDFEIAGVRIGNPITQGDFNFSSLLPNTDGTAAWLNTAKNHDVVEHIFSEGESIVKLSKKSQSHTSSAEASSIMGNAGPAMVIPMSEKIEAWEGKSDPNIDAVKYSTDKLYFSVLLRVTNMDREEVYPYPNNYDYIPVIYLVVGSDGKVIRRVYKFNENYFTSNEENAEFKYTPGETEDVLGFCWAALPVGAKWEAGKIYTYKLNYTNGIGWHDPADPTPGEPIIERGKVPFEVNVEEWIPAEGYDPNLDVPKR